MTDDQKKIIVWKDKHRDKYYAASTTEELDASAIKILTELMDERYGYWAFIEDEPYMSTRTRQLYDMDPDDVPDLFKEEHTRAVAVAERAIREHQYLLDRNNQAKKYIKNGVSERNSRGTPLSWALIVRYAGGEYEDIGLERLE